jgi:UDP-N-acetylmuramoyl-L-alanyl-D-glutamate--2,6-diaminopimelate ligase
MNLDELLSGLAGARIHGIANRPISSLAYDSRQVQPGGLFVAISGYHVDGHAYIPQALERGAAAIVVDARHWAPERAAIPADRTLVVVPDSRLALAPLAAAFAGYPGRRLGVVGVTGTKGKTTASGLVCRALESAGHATGLINSVDFQVGTRQWPNTTRQSTPEAPDIQALLREMVDAGCAYAVIEATSHGLSHRWNRVGCCAFDVAVFTNLSHEHLDFHGTFEQYRADKARLFEMLGEYPAPGAQVPGLPPAKARKYAVVNADDPQHTYFLDAAPAGTHHLTYAIDAPADIRATRLDATPAGTALHVATPWGNTEMRLRLPGTFNVHNALAALAAALTQGVPLETAAQALGSVAGMRGRMERIEEGQPFAVIVDYAHNPDSFERVLGMLRPLVAGQMIAVFGSAGERDREKRPLQGAIAARFCDLLILTDEDPRREDRGLILAEIAAGVEQVGTPYQSIPDRRAALRAACERARPGDMVLLLGKGHETSIEYADGKHPWDEAAEARAALRDLGWRRS